MQNLNFETQTLQVYPPPPAPEPPLPGIKNITMILETISIIKIVFFNHQYDNHHHHHHHSNDLLHHGGLLLLHLQRLVPVVQDPLPPHLSRRKCTFKHKSVDVYLSNMSLALFLSCLLLLTSPS